MDTLVRIKQRLMQPAEPEHAGNLDFPSEQHTSLSDIKPGYPLLKALRSIDPLAQMNFISLGGDALVLYIQYLSLPLTNTMSVNIL